MYRVPKTADFSFLIGKMVVLVSLGQYQTQVHLIDEPISNVLLSIECKHTLVLAEKNRELVWERDGFPSEGISKLLGQTVSGVAVVDETTVPVAFSQGDVPWLFDDSDQYESFQVTCEGRIFVV